MNCLCCKHWDECPKDIKDNRSYIPPHYVMYCGGWEPAFITPRQFRERTGREYPDIAPVWVKAGKGIKAGVMQYGEWILNNRGWVKTEEVI